MYRCALLRAPPHLGAADSYAQSHTATALHGNRNTLQQQHAATATHCTINTRQQQHAATATHCDSNTLRQQHTATATHCNSNTLQQQHTATATHCNSNTLQQRNSNKLQHQYLLHRSLEQRIHRRWHIDQRVQVCHILSHGQIEIVHTDTPVKGCGGGGGCNQK